MHKLSVRLATIVFCGFIFICGTSNGAGAADVPELNSSPAPASTPTPAPTQLSSSQPSGINLQQLPSLIEIPQTPESIERVLKLENEGENLFTNHLLDKALAKWQEAYGMALEMKYSEGEGRALTNMGRVFIERGQYVKAKYMGENAIEVLAGVADKKALGRAHLYLAQAYFGLDNPLWAGEQLDDAMKVFSSDGGNNAADTAKVMNIAANVLVKIGKLKEALQFLQASAMYSGQCGDNTGCISSRIQVVDVLLALGLSTAAQEEADKAVSVARTAPDQLANLSAALSCLANCKVALGEYNEARKTYEQVLLNCKSIPKAQLNNIARANIYLGYGTTLSALHKYEMAKQVLDIALPVFKAAGASFSQAQVANTLGIVESELGQDTKAKELLDQALDLHNLISPKQDAFRVTVLENLACLESRQGQNSQARAHFLTCVEQLKKVKEGTLLGRVDLALAEIAFKLAEVGEAEHWLNDAIKYSQPMNDDSALWREYTLLAKIQLAQNNVKAAHESLLSAVSFFRSPQAGAFPSPEHIEYPTRRVEAAYQLVYLLAQEKLFDQALLACDQIKQELFLNDWTSRDELVRDVDTDLYNDLVTQRAHLHAAEVSSPPGKIVKEWQNWIVRFRAFSAQNRAVARLIMPLPVVLADVVHTAQTNHTTVLDYLLGPDSTILFVIGSDGRITTTTWNGGSAHINGQMNSLLGALTQQDNQADTTLSLKLLHSLHDELLPAAIQPLLPTDEKETLTIIPDGALSDLPFGALVNSQNKFLVSRHAITCSSTLATMLDSAPRTSNEVSFLFASSDSSIEDIKTMASTLPSSAVKYLNGEAAMKDLSEQAKGQMVVHIASKLKLETDSIDSILSSPLSCDLLALSGTQAEKWTGKDNYRMAPVGIVAQRCQSAGARNVLISLWRHSSIENSRQWQEFYSNLLSGMTPISALRKTQLGMITHGDTPADWAQLQLFGPGN